MKGRTRGDLSQPHGPIFLHTLEQGGFPSCWLMTELAREAGNERARTGRPTRGAAYEAEIDDAPLHLISPSQGQLQQGWPPEVQNIQLQGG